MEELINKLSEEEKEKLECLLRQLNDLFDESENITEAEYDEFCGSKFYIGLRDMMYDLGMWC